VINYIIYREYAQLRREGLSYADALVTIQEAGIKRIHLSLVKYKVKSLRTCPVENILNAGNRHNQRIQRVGAHPKKTSMTLLGWMSVKIDLEINHQITSIVIAGIHAQCIVHRI
jgi:hypothetical protein